MPKGPKVSYGCVSSVQVLARVSWLSPPPLPVSPLPLTHTHSISAMVGPQGDRCAEARLKVGLFIMALLLTLGTQDKDPPAMIRAGFQGCATSSSSCSRLVHIASISEREKREGGRENKLAAHRSIVKSICRGQPMCHTVHSMFETTVR